MDWTAVGAIGTVLSAFATVWAVLVALKTNKPKVRLSCIEHAIDESGRFSRGNIDEGWMINVTNVGYMPITIEAMGYRMGKTHFAVNPDPQWLGALPKKIETSEKASVWTEMPVGKLWILKYKDLMFATDSMGNEYYVKIGIIKTAIRSLWFTFGKANN